MKRTLLFFVLAVAVGIYVADYQVHRMQGQAEYIAVWDIAAADDGYDLHWMGEAYSLVRRNAAQEWTITAAGLNYNIEESGRLWMRRAEAGVRYGRRLWEEWDLP